MQIGLSQNGGCVILNAKWVESKWGFAILAREGGAKRLEPKKGLRQNGGLAILARDGGAKRLDSKWGFCDSGAGGWCKTA